MAAMMKMMKIDVGELERAAAQALGAADCRDPFSLGLLPLPENAT
jgi:hypothetical protein